MKWIHRINPNHVTAFRLVCAAAVLFLCPMNSFWALCFSMIFMLTAEATDWIDGRLARISNRESDWGKLFDPMCDCIYHMTVWICFLSLGWVAVYFIVIFLARDAIVAYMRVYLALQRTLLKARYAGKVKAVAQGACQIAIIFLHISQTGNCLPENMYEYLPQATNSITIIAICVTIFSLYDYSAYFYRLVKENRIIIR